MAKSKRFPYTIRKNGASPEDAMPFLPIVLSRGTKSTEVLALADSGATINVLPHKVGLELGAIWENQLPLFRLAGNLGNFESRGLILEAKVEDFDPVKLAFAWTKADGIPVILGQTNFFAQFDVCFIRQDNEFELKMA